MDPTLVLKVPPPFDPAWLLYESQQPTPTTPAPDIQTHKKDYILSCRTKNDLCLSTTHSHLSNGLSITNTTVTILNQPLNYRTYSPHPPPPSDKTIPAVIYYHGGGLYVGDLDSEDLSCRLITKQLQCIVYSCDYRQLPECSPDDALSDAISLFRHLLSEKTGPFIVMGSSSGGQLAAQVSQNWLLDPTSPKPRNDGNLIGVLLRAPVTCNAYDLPERYKNTHTSFSPVFHNSVISDTCVDSLHRTTAKLPLEEERLKGLPRHWIQVCSNDIFYSDGACYASALKGEGVDVKLEVVSGWPHTFWLAAPQLEASVQAESEMIEGLRWLMDGNV